MPFCIFYHFEEENEKGEEAENLKMNVYMESLSEFTLN